MVRVFWPSQRRRQESLEIRGENKNRRGRPKRIFFYVNCGSKDLCEKKKSGWE